MSMRGIQTRVLLLRLANWVDLVILEVTMRLLHIKETILVGQLLLLSVSWSPNLLPVESARIKGRKRCKIPTTIMVFTNLWKLVIDTAQVRPVKWTPRNNLNLWNPAECISLSTRISDTLSLRVRRDLFQGVPKESHQSSDSSSKSIKSPVKVMLTLFPSSRRPSHSFSKCLKESSAERS